MIWMLLAAAGPTYLECSFPREEGPWVVSLTVDESNQRVTIGRPQRPPVVLDALFAPDRVVATERISGETQTWTVSRTDLSVTTTVSFSENVNTGRCEVKPAPAERAF